jgi:phosphoribosylcarboxyaminoimidazole (NCAIR) mutase
MPPGGSLTMVGPNQGGNAALAAIKQLGNIDESYAVRLDKYVLAQTSKVETKDGLMQEIGLRSYIEQS